MNSICFVFFIIINLRVIVNKTHLIWYINSIRIANLMFIILMKIYLGEGLINISLLIF